MDFFLQTNTLNNTFSMATKKSRIKNAPGLLPPVAEPVVEGLLYPVLQADNLLRADSTRRHFMQKISRYAHLELPLYQELYGRTLTQFAECVQALPHQSGSRAGSLLDYSLERATASLRLYRQVAGADFSDLCAYTLFMAALFQDIGKVISQQVVLISDVEGKTSAEWRPFEGSLPAIEAHYYKYRTLDDRWITLGKGAAPLLARQCMSVVGFEWIASDPKMLALWIAILTGDEERERELLQFLQLPYQLIRFIPIQDHLLEMEFEVTRPLQTVLAEDFINWLKNRLRDNDLAFNTEEAQVHGLGSGELLLETELLKKYCTEKNIGLATLARQLHAVGLTRTGEASAFEKFSTAPETLARENIARMPTTLGGFFNASGVTGAVARAALMREGVVIIRPDCVLNKALGQSAVPLVPISPPPAAASIAAVQYKIQGIVQAPAADKPFLK